jgi:ubiquinone/menaquinone biosynthesis C-methylase UbiE
MSTTRANVASVDASSKERVRSLFDGKVHEWAAMYESGEPSVWSAQDLVMRRRFALEMIQASVPEGSKILDLGCGTGDMAAELMQNGYDVWGVDIAEQMIRYVRARLRPDRFRVGDVEHIDFPDGTFDAVVCLGVLEYLDRDGLALREILRVLKPGGRAVISTPNALCFFHHSDRVIRIVMAVLRRLHRIVKGPQKSPPRHLQVRHRRYHRRSWFRLLRQANLEPECWLCHSWGWYTLTPFFGQTSLCRASERFARIRAVNWLANTQIVRVRAAK